MVWSAIAGPIAGGLVRGGFSALGQLMANRESKRSAERAMQFSAEQAQLNRDWQERMASTRYQRTMADMRSAGLNPILAYQQGGGPLPGGAQASGAQYTAGNIGGDVGDLGISSAVQGYRASLEGQKLKWQLRQMRWHAEKMREEARSEAKKQWLYTKQADVAETTAELQSQQTKTSSAQMQRWEYQNARDAMETALTETIRQHKRLDLPRAALDERFYKSVMGKYLRYWGRAREEGFGGRMPPLPFGRRKFGRPDSKQRLRRKLGPRK